MTHYHITRAALVAVATTILSACPTTDSTNGNGTTAPPTPTPTSISVVSGGGQSATVGQALTNPVVIQVNDQSSNPMSNVDVTFSVTQGSVGSATATTGTDGRASTTWTLGTTAEVQNLTVAVASKTSVNATATATATADVAAALVEVSGGGQQQQINAPLPNAIVVRVDDQFGNPVQGHAVDFVVTSGTGSVNGMGTTATVPTDASGEAAAQWTLGPEQPTQTVEAQATGLTGTPVAFTANVTGAAPASVEVSAGDNQSGEVGDPVNTPPAVLVKDAAGVGFPGATVDFAVASGGGSATGLSTTTDANGIAEVGSWTLGAMAGTNTITATVTGSGITGNPITFTGTGITPAFDIEVRFVVAPTMAQQEAFDSAEVFWERLVIGDLADQMVTVGAGACTIAPSHPAISEMVDDLLIYMELDSIDGPAGTLAQAGFCFRRIGSSLPILGGMLFDTADVANLLTAGELDEVALHEMGHVLGIGSLWDRSPFNFLQNPSVSQCPTIVDTHFDGPLAIAAFDDVGGTTYMAGDKVPVENDCTSFGSGSLDGHWRESEFTTEAMTPALNSGVANPLSIVSVASLADLGYVTNYSKADAYAYPGPAFFVAQRSASVIVLKNDVWRGPQYFLDASGRVINARPRR